jgi:predicted component of type VI protein secretion system
MTYAGRHRPPAESFQDQVEDDLADATEARRQERQRVLRIAIRADVGRLLSRDRHAAKNQTLIQVSSRHTTRHCAGPGTSS